MGAQASVRPVSPLNPGGMTPTMVMDKFEM